MAKKPFKTLTATALTAAFAASAVVPVAAAETSAEAATSVSHYVVDIDGKAVQVTVAEFGDLRAAGIVTMADVLYLKAGNTVYTVATYQDAKAALIASGETSDQGSVLEFLTEKEVPSEEVEIFEPERNEDGTIKVVDGGIVPGEPAEEGPTPAEEALAEAQAAVDALPAVDAVKVEDKAAVAAAKALVAEAKELGADVAALETKVAALEAKIAELEAAFTVEAVTANNLKTITVKFNTAVNADTLKYTGSDATVKVFKNSSTTAETVAGTLSADKKTLTLVVGTDDSTKAFEQSDSAKVWISGVKNDQGKVLSTVEQTITVTDVTAPVAEALEVVNSKTLKVKFSEAVDVTASAAAVSATVANIAADLKIDGQTAFTGVKLLPGENAIELSLFTALSDGEHKLSVAEVKDFAGFKAPAKEFTFTTAADATAPTATAIEYVNKTTVKVTFDEALKETTAGSKIPTGTFTAFQAGDSANKVTAAALSDDKKTVTLTLSDLTVASTVGLDVKYVNVEDIFGNKKTTETTISTKATDDLVKPTVSSVEVLAGNKVRVTFSEDVTAAAANFSLLKEDNTVVNSAAASINKVSAKVYELEFAGLASTNAANFKVKVTGVQDTSIRTNTIENATFAIVAKDSMRPTLATATVITGTDTTNKYELVFSEAMDASLLSNTANYIVDGTKTAADSTVTNLTDESLSLISGATVSVSSDNKKVVISVPKKAATATTGDTFELTTIAAPTLKDAAGNLISNAAIATPVSVDASYTAINATDLTVTAVNSNTIEVAVKSTSAYTISSVAADALTLQNAVGQTRGIGSVQLSSDGKKITVTTTGDKIATATDVALVVGTDKVKDQNGLSLAAQTLNVADKVAPMFVNAKYTVANDAVAANNKEYVITSFTNGLSASIDLSTLVDTATVGTAKVTTSEAGTLQLLSPYIAAIGADAYNVSATESTFAGLTTVTVKELREAAKLDGDGDDKTLTLTGKLVDEAADTDPVTAGVQHNEAIVTLKIKVSQ